MISYSDSGGLSLESTASINMAEDSESWVCMLRLLEVQIYVGRVSSWLQIVPRDVSHKPSKSGIC